MKKGSQVILSLFTFGRLEFPDEHNGCVSSSRPEASVGPDKGDPCPGAGLGAGPRSASRCSSTMRGGVHWFAGPFYTPKRASKIGTSVGVQPEELQQLVSCNSGLSHK